MSIVKIKKTYPTERTRPVSLRSASPETPLMRSSRIEETSVGVALASANPLLATREGYFKELNISNDELI